MYSKIAGYYDNYCDTYKNHYGIFIFGKCKLAILDVLLPLRFFWHPSG